MTIFANMPRGGWGDSVCSCASVFHSTRIWLKPIMRALCLQTSASLKPPFEAFEVPHELMSGYLGTTTGHRPHQSKEAFVTPLLIKCTERALTSRILVYLICAFAFLSLLQGRLNGLSTQHERALN